MIFFPNFKNNRWLPLLILLLGMAVRWVVFAENRSVFIDEANLARAIFEASSWRDFFAPLPHDQFAPPFFLLLEKGMTLLLGHSEFALRLLPTLLACHFLYLAWKVMQGLGFSQILQAVGLFFLSFSDFFIRYATEIKQYSTDAWAAMLLFFLFLKFEKSARRWWLWGAVGAVLVWFSMPVVFVLAGVALADYFSFKLDENFTQNFKKWVAMTAVWLASFGCYYFLFLQKNIENQALQLYHSPFFLQLFPPDSSTFAHLDALVYYTFGHTVLAKIVGWWLLLTGCWGLLFQKNYRMAGWLVVPCMLCLGASVVGKYSLIPRLLLWLFPLILFIQLIGFQYFIKKMSALQFFQKNNLAWQILPILLLPSLVLHDGWQFFGKKKLEVEDTRGAIQFLAKNKLLDDVLWVNHETAPAYIFYVEWHDDRTQFGQLPRAHYPRWDENWADFAEKQPRGKRIWSLHGHLISEASRQTFWQEVERARSVGDVEVWQNWTGAAVFLCVKSR